MVLYSHSFALAQGDGYFDPLRSIVGITFGTIAVDIFFITSGFLITASLLLRDNLIAFVWNRILRIYPALIIAIVFCVFVVGVVFTTLKTGQYLLDPDTYKFLIKNTTLVFGLHHTLPHVFESVPYKSAINGSLWTLPIEIRMYGLLFLMGLFCYMFCRFNKKYLFFIKVSVGNAIVIVTCNEPLPGVRFSSRISKGTEIIIYVFCRVVFVCFKRQSNFILSRNNGHDWNDSNSLTSKRCLLYSLLCFYWLHCYMVCIYSIWNSQGI